MRLSTLAVGATTLFSIGAICGVGGLGDAPFTDDPANRERAAAVASAYVAEHRAELLEGSAGVVGGDSISGGRLAGTSERAFEVRLEVSGDERITELVVYVYDADGLVVAGAQARDQYGAVVRDIGGHLDRSFVSRD